MTSGRPKTCPRAPFFSARGRGRALGPPKISERPPWNPIWGPGGSKRPPWSIKTPTFSGQGFQKEILLPVAATDTFFRKCLSGPHGKQYLFFENLTPLGRGPPNGPSRHQKTSKNDPLGIEIIKKRPPRHPKMCTRFTIGCSIHTVDCTRKLPYHSGFNSRVRSLGGGFASPRPPPFIR